jgi:hypothetical protein
LNTKFFHMSAMTRIKKKKVSKLVNGKRKEVTSQEELCDVAKKYFDKLFRPNDGVHVPVS